MLRGIISLFIEGNDIKHAIFRTLLRVPFARSENPFRGSHSEFWNVALLLLLLSRALLRLLRFALALRLFWQLSGPQI